MPIAHQDHTYHICEGFDLALYALLCGIMQWYSVSVLHSHFNITWTVAIVSIMLLQSS